MFLSPKKKVLSFLINMFQNQSNQESLLFNSIQNQTNLKNPYSSFDKI